VTDRWAIAYTALRICAACVAR